MDTLSEFGQALKQRRAEMGLTQAQVAELSGLSRQTVSQLETGCAPDLGIKKVEKLAAELGMSLRLELNTSRRRLRPKLDALKRAAQTGNVSYILPLSKTIFKRIVVNGEAPNEFVPHVHAILDDAPTSLLASVADQVHQETRLSKNMVWRNFRSLASQVKSKRDLWK